jgi:peroxiredoxin
MHAYRDQYAKLFRGGRGVVLIAISSDPAEALQSWAEDDEFPFLMASDPGFQVASTYGVPLSDNNMIRTRPVIVVDPEGKVAWTAAPFREIDPQAYEELGAAIDRVAPAMEADD